MNSKMIKKSHIYIFIIKTCSDIKVTLFLIEVIKHTLHLKLTTSDLFTYDKLNQ